MMVQKILLMNGPNLNMLGIREPEVYGSGTLEDLETMVAQYAGQFGVALDCFQSNSEAALIDRIHAAAGSYGGIVYNPGAHSHYSYAIRDAIAAVEVPVVEVHISDVDSREAFRHVSVTAPACAALVKGLGLGGYCRAVDILRESDALLRLGEGFETRFPEGVRILVAGQEAPAEGLSDEAPAAQSEESDARGVDDFASQHEDFAVPYADDVAQVDLGFVSHQRLEAVRGVLGQLGVGALLVRDTPNIEWLTAFDGVFDEERAHALLITPGRAVLHTDSRYSNAVRAAASAIGSEVVVDDSRVAHAKFVSGALAAEAEALGGRLGMEDTVSYAEFVKLVEEVGADRLASTSDVVLQLRAVKTRPELSRLLAAQAVTDAAFEHIVKYMRPGMTEREVQLELEDFMLRHGGEGLAFRSIVATGANGADPHAVPGSTRLEAGQCVVMDFGAKAYGYCSDMTRMVFLGLPDAAKLRAWEVLRCANESVEDMLRPGVTGKEAHELAEHVLAEGGYAGKMGHGLGHGVGVEVHERPVLNTRNDKPLVAGNVVTVEPGIYLPGEFGMRLEDCGVVTTSGYEPFSQLGHEMVVI